jgi:hypothetical protein
LRIIPDAAYILLVGQLSLVNFEAKSHQVKKYLRNDKVICALFVSLVHKYEQLFGKIYNVINSLLSFNKDFDLFLSIFKQRERVDKLDSNNSEKKHGIRQTQAKTRKTQGREKGREA